MHMNVKNWFLAIALAFTAGGGLLATVPQVAQAGCEKNFLTFPVWYRGLEDSKTCNLKSPSQVSGGLTAYIWTIVLNIIDILLQAVGYLSVVFIIYGGFQYLTSAGSADGVTKGKKTITNAIIGLMLSIVSVAIVTFISGAIS